MSDKIVDIHQLRVGMFVQLDLPWMDHPFLSSSFKIRSRKQLAALKGLGLSEIRIDPERSDRLPLEEPEEESTPEPAAEVKEDLTAALWEEKTARIRRLKERRGRLNLCAKRYAQTVGAARKLMSHLRASPIQATEEATELVTQIVDELTEDSETTVQLVNLKNQDEGSYNHAINVVALAMVVGQKLELDKPELRLLGLGALFHDLGHLKIPSQILLKKGVLTQPERQFLAQHPRYGADLARQIKTLPAAVVEIIARHHEHLDGSGYPEGLGAKDIGTLTRIVTVVNRYDNLCNGFTVDHPLSPHQAISQMYSKEREQYDPKVMTTFITNLGVYPPGTIVRLKDERVAVVVSINADDLLKPNVLVYAPEIPSTEALVLDLAEEGVAISESLRRSDLTAEQIEYLNLSDKLTYYFQSPKASPRR
ncbi:HD-GYP domain-containing protein [Thiorhodococcus mannitoliphagus]|uniref:HD-GYP domain-containing protein n=1 Tax=Thiorhodococcus mannitoliphagus TaxID=329406 RepID=A0A6P1DSK1_9GAMM|nr:HD-GYP domain-containing protein [Thiorhodococcus mannitoliphagus]